MRKKTKIQEAELNKLLDFIISELKSKGMKGTTMDSIAASKKISKRTLYEIFKSKENMFLMALDRFQKRSEEVMNNLFNSSSDIMEAILKCFLYNRDVMSSLNVEFLRDVNQYYCSQLKKDELRYEKAKERYLGLLDVLLKGVEEGYFRNDINLKVQCHMLIIQMESLKRMEELFPKDISLLEAYDNIILGFLRSISTIKGFEALDKTPNMIQTDLRNQLI